MESNLCNQLKWLAVAMLVSVAPLRGQGEAIKVSLRADYGRGVYFFVPAGIYISPGEKVSFSSDHYIHSVTAYHPDNDKHELRIPEGAKPFDVLMGDAVQDQKETVELAFEVEGTYDFFCRYHENVGEVGRIVVGKPDGPGEKPLAYSAAVDRPFGYTGASLPTTGLKNVRRVLEFLSSAEIIRQKKISLPVDLFKNSSAWHSLNEPIP